MGVDLGIQLVEHTGLMVRSQKMFIEKGTDETGAAGHKDAHHKPFARSASPSDSAAVWSLAPWRGSYGSTLPM